MKALGVEGEPVKSQRRGFWRGRKMVGSPHTTKNSCFFASAYTVPTWNAYPLVLLLEFEASDLRYGVVV